MRNVIFVAGIDTDAGKSYATGWYARMLMEKGQRVITQKFVQTGNREFSEDIEVHRRIMGTGMLPEDLDHITAPVIFSYPASPQLAASIDNRSVDIEAIDRSARLLSTRYDAVLIEGAGGLMVPLTDDYFSIDYPRERKLKIVLVTNARLGSINHTVLALEAIKRRGMRLKAILYNEYYDNDPMIAPDTYGFICRYVGRHFSGIPVIRIPAITEDMISEPPHRKAVAAPQPELPISISKIQLAELPQVTFPGTISVIEHETQARQAFAWIMRQKIVGFDTETRPSFRKGKTNGVALVQISTPRRCFLFRVNKLGFTPELRAFLESESVKKVGLSLKDDFHALSRSMGDFTPGGFIDLQAYVRGYDIADSSLQKIYGIIFGKRISKNQRLSNWEADTLSEAQQIYAAIDAWASLRIYQHLEGGKFKHLESPYRATSTATDNEKA